MREQDIAYGIIRDQDHIRSGFGVHISDGNISIQTLRDKQELRRIVLQADAAQVLGISQEEVNIIKAFYEAENQS